MANIAFKMAEVRKGKTPDRLTANEDRQILEMRSAYSQAVVTLLMSYDLACRLYRDGAVDRDRFRRQHEYETRKLFEEGTDEDRALLQSVATPYQALRAVYVDWFVKEKQ